MFWYKDINKLEVLETALNVICQIPFNRLRHGTLLNN
jgi:hypothetical protein